MNMLETIWNDMRRGLGEEADKGRTCCFAKDQWEMVSKERLKVLITTIPQRVKDLVAAKGGYTKWQSNSYNIGQEKWNSTSASLKKMRGFYIETVFVWEPIVNLFQVFHAKTTPTFPDLRSALGTCFWYMGPPPSTGIQRRHLT